MAKYRLKPMILEAMSFDELIEYGRTQTTNIYNNMPWSFEYLGHPVTHETDDCYIISIDGEEVSFTKNKMLIVENNNLIPMNLNQFNQTCELSEE
jgi:hypothetical protein